MSVRRKRSDPPVARYASARSVLGVSSQGQFSQIPHRSCTSDRHLGRTSRSLLQNWSRVRLTRARFQLLRRSRSRNFSIAIFFLCCVASFPRRARYVCRYLDMRFASRLSIGFCAQPPPLRPPPRPRDTAFLFAQVKPSHITFHRKKNLQYYDISAKSNYNFEKPFLYLARRLVGDPNLMFVEMPVLSEPLLAAPQISDRDIRRWEEELAAATEQLALPDDDDEF